MSSSRRTFIAVLWMLVLAGVVLAVVLHQLQPSRASESPEDRFISSQPHALPDLFPIGPFQLTDQEGRAVDEASFRGQTWIGMLFFTRCKAACPMMIGRMKEIEKAVPTPAVKLVCISVDPNYDTPEVLKDFAEASGADLPRWSLLTGSPEQMEAGAAALKLSAGQREGDIGAGHSQKMLLIDTRGIARGVYETGDDDDMKRLAMDAAELAGLSLNPGVRP